MWANGVDDGSDIDAMFCLCEVGQYRFIAEGVYWPGWIIIWIGSEVSDYVAQSTMGHSSGSSDLSCGTVLSSISNFCRLNWIETDLAMWRRG